MNRTLVHSALCVLAPLALVACGGGAQTPPPATPAQPTAAPQPPAAKEPPKVTGPLFGVLIRPIHDPSPVVHVEIELAVPGTSFPVWRVLRSPADRIVAAHARDDAGDLGVAVSAQGASALLTMARPTSGLVHLAYDVRANLEAPDDPLGELVLDDRFRGAGEGMLALPEAILDTTIPTEIRIDGEPLRAPNAASSLGVGARRRTDLRPRALWYSSFVAGSMGAAVLEDPSNGRDEGAWLGYTAFDPRPAIAEIAVVRTALGELLKRHEDAPEAYLFLSQTRPIGSFSTTGRAASVLVQVGPSEPWSASLRLSIAQQLAHRWIGGELRMTAPQGHEAEAWWFNDGVARFLAMHTLSRLGLFTANDVRAEIGGQLSVLATTPLGKLGNADLAAQATTNDVARAVLVARGALYAAREAAVIRARGKGDKSLDDALVALASHAYEAHDHAVSPATWIEAIAKLDPEAQKSYDAIIVRGAPVELPGSALGPCFHAGVGDYIAFDPGFDVVATNETKDARVVGLRADGPAAKAGLREGDLVESMSEREGDPDVPVKMVVSRAGSKVTIQFAPKGPKGHGQIWTRVRSVLDDRCGEVP